jgi:hypothetical protein
MYNAIVMQVCNRFNDSPHKMSGITLEIATLLTDTVEQLSSKSKISHQVHYGGNRESCKLSKGKQACMDKNETLQLTIIKGFKVVHQAQNVLVILRDFPKHIDLITNHMFTTFHQSLVNDFHRIIFASFDLMRSTVKRKSVYKTK